MRWVRCELIDLRDEREPPDFSKVPAERRAMVERNWQKSFVPNEPEIWHLWESQIPAYRAAGFKVTSLD